jgi:hypothetical protein
VLEIEMFSVVPRVTDAQPQHGTAIAAANTSLIIGLFPRRRTIHATSGRKQHATRDYVAVLLTRRGVLPRHGQKLVACPTRRSVTI